MPDLGVAIIGSGRIGSLRARLVKQHPSLKFLAVSDLDPARAQALKDTVGADFASGSNEEVIARPEVNAVIVSSSEGEHTLPIRLALEMGKMVLVEKPLALSLKEADDTLDDRHGTGRAHWRDCTVADFILSPGIHR